MLEFTPQIKHFDIKWESFTKTTFEIKKTTEYQKYIYIPLQNENWCLASKASIIRKDNEKKNKKYPR